MSEVQSTSGGYQVAIVNLSARKDVDVDKLERLMKLQEVWEERQALAHFNDMMASAQGKMSRISKDSANPSTRSRYASLEALDTAIRPHYTECGFGISFTEEDSTDTSVMLMAIVSCGSHVERYRKRIPVVTRGIGGREAMTLTHASIGAITYGRRTLLKMIFNLAEADDDGNLAGGKPQARPEREEPPFNGSAQTETSRLSQTYANGKPVRTYADRRTPPEDWEKRFGPSEPGEDKDD